MYGFFSLFRTGCVIINATKPKKEGTSMKRLLLIFTLSLFAITLAACADEKPIEDNGDTAETLDIYYLNDLHGAITPSGDAMGMAYIGNFLLHHKQENPESTLILAGGDMLQGSALSNYYHGESVVELMNATKFDALANKALYMLTICC